MMKEIFWRLDRIITLIEENYMLGRFSKKYLSSKEAAAYLCISESELDKMALRREIEYSKPGGKKRYFSIESLERYASKNVIRTTEAMGRLATENFLD